MRRTRFARRRARYFQVPAGVGRRRSGSRLLTRVFRAFSVCCYDFRMPLIVLLRGVNVGGHRTFRPSILARELCDFDVVNVGAAGTFVVRKPVSRADLRAEVLRKLPFKTEVVICDARDLIRIDLDNPFGSEPTQPNIVRFVSFLSKSRRVRVPMPITLPPVGEWSLRVIAATNRFVFGEYRRHMKAIGYLGKIDKLFGVPATTRNWNTIKAVVRILKGDVRKSR